MHQDLNVQNKTKLTNIIIYQNNLRKFFGQENSILFLQILYYILEIFPVVLQRDRVVQLHRIQPGVELMGAQLRYVVMKGIQIKIARNI